MKCTAAERLVLEGEERPLREKERGDLDAHLRGCPECRDFAAGRGALQQALECLGAGPLPASLDQGTRRACLEELDRQRKGTAGALEARVPWPVIVASALFALLAAVWLGGTLAEVKPGDILPWTAWAAVAFMAQNVFVLFLSPVLLRAARRPGAEGEPTP